MLGIMNRFMVVLSVFMVLCVGVSAENGYSCDFEDEVENARWQRNTGPRAQYCANRWYVGAPGRNNGENGLFVSADGGASAGYTNRGVAVVASRTLTLDAGVYDFSFEWQAFGLDSLDGLYVCWMPDSIKTNSVDNSNLQKWVLNDEYSLRFGAESARLYQRGWNVAADTIVSDGSPHKLVFVWNNGVVGSYPPAACIDNIMVIQKGFCDKPTDLSVRAEGESVVFKWRGTAGAYDVKCYSQSGDRWVMFDEVSADSVVINGLDEGLCDYYVRSSCGEYYSGWVSVSEFLYFPGTRCVDYLTLTKENCYYGLTGNPRANRGVVDHGFQSKASRHTLHYLKTERDPRTGNLLKTVPDGEVASVRLGNWDVNAEAECVQYQYTVDVEKSAILLLKYAVVLEDPGHDSIQQPRFTLQVLRNNRPLDDFGCAEAYFSAGYNTGDWNVDGAITWKDWTTVGINLRDYDGETLTIRLTSYDCTQEGHYGYAYFTLGCSDGRLKGESCGEDPQNRFEGPDGFRYRWYLESNPGETLGTEQVFSVEPSDTLTYNVDVIHPTQDKCYYTLQASAMPKLPMAVPEYTVSTVDCKSVVSFKNESYVLRINQITGDSVQSEVEKCETYHWDFGDGTSSDEFEPVHTFPAEGGRFEVRLSAGIANNHCIDDSVVYIELPRLGVQRDTTSVDWCEGLPFEFAGKSYFNSGTYSDTVTGDEGCMVISTVVLSVHEKVSTQVYDTICSGDEYYFGGERIEKSGQYRYVDSTYYGCDSVVTLDIVVNESLIADIASEVDGCADDEQLLIPYTLVSGALSEYSVEFEDEAMRRFDVKGGVPTDGYMAVAVDTVLRPGHYKAKVSFGEQSCGKEPVDINFSIRYPSETVVQRWNDVLAVTNGEYNGGYEFVAYQWYKGESVLEGAIFSNYYTGEDEVLDTASEYSVLLVRAEDGVSQMTCPFKPEHFAELPEVSVTFNQGGDVQYIGASEEGVVTVWNSLGVVVDRFAIGGAESQTRVAYSPGVYVMALTAADGRVVTEKFVVH